MEKSSQIHTSMVFFTANTKLLEMAILGSLDVIAVKRRGITVKVKVKEGHV